MHKEAREFLWEHASNETGMALDLGGYNVNGHCRDLWPKMSWTVIDLRPTEWFPAESPDVYCHKYIVADAAWWEPDIKYDWVLCTEVFEHTKDWALIIATASKALNSGGTFLATCAGPHREPHSAVDGGALRKGEYYRNLLPHEIGSAMRSRGFLCRTICDHEIGDIYAYALKK